MSRILGFAGSNSSTSINQQLVGYAASLVKNADAEVIRLADFTLPIYSEDIEKESGFPKELVALMEKIKADIEAGGKAGLFDVDEKTLQFVEARAKRAYTVYRDDFFYFHCLQNVWSDR